MLVATDLCTSKAIVYAQVADLLIWLTSSHCVLPNNISCIKKAELKLPLF